MNITRVTDFTPVGGWFSAGFTDSLPITFQAYDDGTLRGTYTVFVNQGGPTYIDFTAFNGFTSIDELRIDTPNSFNSFGGYFGFDDFSYRSDAAAATGNVLTGVDGGLGSDANASPLDGTPDTVGADGFGSIVWSGAVTSGLGITTVVGLYGTMTVDALGNYSYKLDERNPIVIGWSTGDAPLVETFNYTIVDGDGDASTTTLTINVTGADDGVGLFDLTPAINGGDAVVNESNLVDGSSPVPSALTQSGTFSFSAPDGVDNLIVGGVNVVTNGAVTVPPTPIATAYGQLTVADVNLATGKITYSYALTDNTLTHGSGDSGTNSVFDSIGVTLTDTDGDSSTSALAIRVIDDVPLAVNDTNTVAEDAVAAITGNVLTNDLHPNGLPGADTPTSFVSWDGDVTGDYGTFVSNADGSYSYTLNNGNALVQGLDVGGTLTETFNYTMKDADGDTCTATLTITITGATDSASVVTAEDGRRHGGRSRSDMCSEHHGDRAAASRSRRRTVSRRRDRGHHVHAGPDPGVAINTVVTPRAS